MLYKPENNLHEIRHDRAARKIFEAEAEEKAWLLREGNLVGHLKWLTEAAADNYTQAQNPHIQSLTSFEFLVVHYMLEERKRLLDEVIAEIAENFQ